MLTYSLSCSMWEDGALLLKYIEEADSSPQTIYVREVAFDPANAEALLSAFRGQRPGTEEEMAACIGGRFGISLREPELFDFCDDHNIHYTWCEYNEGLV